MIQLVSFLVLVLNTVNAWNYETHFLIGRIAYDLLKQQNPEALQNAEDELRMYSDMTTVANEKDYPLVECIIFGDAIKVGEGSFQKEWHYDDESWIGDGTSESDLEFNDIPQNISGAMPVLLEWISSSDQTFTTDSFAFEEIMEHVLNEEEGRSIALRLLLHYYGDVHQPLHSASRYTSDLPEGDAGGNDFDLKYRLSADNLHALWDNVIYTYRKTIYRPFTNESWAEFGEISSALSEEFPSFEKSEVETLNFTQFRLESFEIAKTAYDNLTSSDDFVVPDEYIDHFVPIAKRRVVLAAHRLAYMIEQVYTYEQNTESLPEILPEIIPEIDPEIQNKSKFKQTFDAFGEMVQDIVDIWTSQTNESEQAFIQKLQR